MIDHRLLEANDPYIRDAYKLILEKATRHTLTGDELPYYTLTTPEIDNLAQLQYTHVQNKRIASGQPFQTYTQMIGDSLYNIKNGVGTLNDPSIYTQAELPVMFGPYEASAEYAGGGLPTEIINKKTHALCLQGSTFVPHESDKEFWTTDKILRLEDAAVTTGFNDACSDALAEAFIYGGAMLYPIFKHDSPSRYVADIENLKLEKGCIEQWKHIDRWNITIVPNWIVTAKDYMAPRTVYLPQGAFELNTSRASMLRPRPQPYWVAMVNLGWCPSDFEGWIRAYHAYAIVCQSVPVMAQQMSLILYRMPLDQLNATLGADKVRELMQINEDKMREWSAINPKAINMIGEVEVVNRTYSGFDQFTGIMKSNLAAQCGLPEPILWHTPNKGFSDNTTESLLKQSETLRMLQHFIERSMSPAIACLIAHVFGKDSQEWENRDKLRISFTRPEITTEKDRAEVGARFAASVSSFCQAGVAPDTALKLTKVFFPTAEITDELLVEAKKSYDEQMEKGIQMGGGMGHQIGVNTNTGKGTKPQ